MSDNMFLGFSEPEQNWSRLPHELINNLPLIKSLAELKVILYVLRHTWGYGDDYKKISLDEFSKGRYLKDGSRMDKGTGMSINAIKDGIKYAIKHGFLEEITDVSDKARIKKYYSLKKNSNSDYQKLIPRLSEVDSRTKKETIERNLNNYVSDASQSPDDFLNQQSLIELPEPKKKIHKPNITYQTVLELQKLEPTIQKGHCLKVVKELLQKYTPQQIIDCAKNLQSNQWWIDNNIKITPSQIKKHIPDFAKQENIDEHGNMVEILEDGTQLIKLQSEIKQDSNIIVVEY